MQKTSNMIFTAGGLVPPVPFEPYESFTAYKTLPSRCGKGAK